MGPREGRPVVKESEIQRRRKPAGAETCGFVPSMPIEGRGEMIVVNTDWVPGYEVEEALGVVRGSTIRAKHIGKDFMAALRNLVGGEVKEYTEMLVEARNESMRRMEKQAEKVGADAVINMRFVTSQVMSGAAELLVYGTAVKLSRKP